MSAKPSQLGVVSTNLRCDAVTFQEVRMRLRSDGFVAWITFAVITERGFLEYNGSYGLPPDPQEMHAGSTTRGSY